MTMTAFNHRKENAIHRTSCTITRAITVRVIAATRISTSVIVTVGEFGVIDTWCVGKEHNVGPRERCFVAMKNMVFFFLLLATSVTFAYAQSYCCFSQNIFQTFIFNKISHTYLPSNLLQHLLKHMGRGVWSRISLEKSKKEQSQDHFSSVNPEFTQEGVESQQQEYLQNIRNVSCSYNIKLLKQIVQLPPRYCKSSLHI